MKAIEIEADAFQPVETAVVEAEIPLLLVFPIFTHHWRTDSLLVWRGQGRLIGLVTIPILPIARSLSFQNVIT